MGLCPELCVRIFRGLSSFEGGGCRYRDVRWRLMRVICLERSYSVCGRISRGVVGVEVDCSYTVDF